MTERASLFGELQLLVDSIALSPTAALLAATRDAARAIGGSAEPAGGHHRGRRYADLVLLGRTRCRTSPIWIRSSGSWRRALWRPGQLRSGIAMN